MTIKYSWDNWSTVEDLAEKFNVTKRRVQQVIVRLGNNVEKAYIISNGNDLNGKPIYRRK